MPLSEFPSIQERILLCQRLNFIHRKYIHWPSVLKIVILDPFFRLIVVSFQAIAENEGELSRRPPRKPSEKSKCIICMSDKSISLLPREAVYLIESRLIVNLCFRNNYWDFQIAAFLCQERTPFGEGDTEGMLASNRLHLVVSKGDGSEIIVESISLVPSWSSPNEGEEMTKKKTATRSASNGNVRAIFWFTKNIFNQPG